MCRESAALLGACGVDLADIRFFEENAVTVLVVSQRKALAVVTQSGAGLDELLDGDAQIIWSRNTTALIHDSARPSKTVVRSYWCCIIKRSGSRFRT